MNPGLATIAARLDRLPRPRRLRAPAKRGIGGLLAALAAPDRQASDAERVKASARRKLYDAVRSGRMVKPERCEECERRAHPTRLQGHHADYSRPLDVRWLCSQCHHDTHSRA